MADRTTLDFAYYKVKMFTRSFAFVVFTTAGIILIFGFCERYSLDKCKSIFISKLLSGHSVIGERIVKIIIVIGNNPAVTEGNRTLFGSGFFIVVRIFVAVVRIEPNCNSEDGTCVGSFNNSASVIVGSLEFVGA